MFILYFFKLLKRIVMIPVGKSTFGMIPAGNCTFTSNESHGKM